MENSNRPGSNLLPTPVVYKNPAKTLVTITGPSGSGKSTLAKLLCGEELTRQGVPTKLSLDTQADFARVVSNTSRQPRPGEEDGVDYYFSTSEGINYISKGLGFVEYNIFNGNFYGTSLMELTLRFLQTDVCVAIVDPNGLRQLLAWEETYRMVPIKSVYITSESDALLDRYSSRMEGVVLTGSAIEYHSQRLKGSQVEKAEWDTWAEGREWLLKIDNSGSMDTLQAACEAIKELCYDGKSRNEARPSVPRSGAGIRSILSGGLDGS